MCERASGFPISRQRVRELHFYLERTHTLSRPGMAVPGRSYLRRFFGGGFLVWRIKFLRARVGRATCCFPPEFPTSISRSYHWLWTTTGGRRNPQGPAATRSALPGASQQIAQLSSFAQSCSPGSRSEEHTSELQSRRDLVCHLLLEKKKRT